MARVPTSDAVHDGPLTEAPLDPDERKWRNAAEVGADESRREWADAAREVLLGVAGSYHEVITHKDLATEVQDRTGLRTKQLRHYWISDVLGQVSVDCYGGQEPLLSSLCVNAAGSVGERYAQAVRDTYGEEPEDADAHAARERLKCYTHFDADLPSDGGSAALTPKLSAARSRTRKALLVETPRPTCRTCHMQLPATGVCDHCG